MSLTIQLALVGDAHVGKTSLVSSFLNEEEFPFSTTTTVSPVTVVAQIDSQLVNVTIFDTPSGDEHEEQRGVLYAELDVVLLCFSVDNRESFQRISSKWNREVYRSKSEARLMLVGCKMDLRERKVMSLEARELSASIGAWYFECSSLSQDFVATVFQAALLRPLSVPPGTVERFISKYDHERTELEATRVLVQRIVVLILCSRVLTFPRDLVLIILMDVWKSRKNVSMWTKARSADDMIKEHERHNSLVNASNTLVEQQRSGSRCILT